MPQPTTNNLDDEKCPFPQFSKECIAFHKRPHRKEDMGIDYSKDNIYDGIGRPDLKPIVNSDSHYNKLEKILLNYSDNIPAMDEIPENDLFDDTVKEIEQFISDLRKHDMEELIKMFENDISNDGFFSPNQVKFILEKYYEK